MSFRASSYLSNKQKQTGTRFPANLPKILARLLLPLCATLLNSVSLPQLAAATLPNRASYDFDGNGTSDLSLARNRGKRGIEADWHGIVLPA
jgi:hypothetical protein